MSYITDDTPLLCFSPHDMHTVEDSFTGAQIFGMTGSGKTSGSAQALIRAMLQAGYGFLVLCAKPGEADLWRRYAKESGRASELLVFGDNEHGFNFLNYEMSSPQGPASANNAVELFRKMIEAGQLFQANAGGNQKFWDDSIKELLQYSIMALYSAYGYVNLDDIIQMSTSAPKQGELQQAQWRDDSFLLSNLKALS